MLIRKVVMSRDSCLLVYMVSMNQRILSSRITHHTLALSGVTDSDQTRLLEPVWKYISESSDMAAMDSCSCIGGDKQGMVEVQTWLYPDCLLD